MHSPAEHLRREIGDTGPISFARFMELALYCPVCGYYEAEKDNIGKHGDFFTSVSVGPLFGELLAFQFAEWLAELSDRPDLVEKPPPPTPTPHPGGGDELQGSRRATTASCRRRHIVEAGAHDGRLALDILRWCHRQRPALLEQIEYVILEPSTRRQQWQRDTLKDFVGRVRWLDELPADPAGEPPFHGVIFANELLDAMPVHRLGWDAKRGAWFEWGVALGGDRFVWTRLTESLSVARFTPHVAPELLAVLPDGFTAEVSPAAEQWWQRAANSLAAGRLLTIDYGLTEDEGLQPERRNGGLRAFRSHRVSDDVLADPGEQDITTDVNFTRLMRAGHEAGLADCEFVSQETFFVNIAERIWEAPDAFGGWTDARTRQFKTLIHPQHLGRSFRALIQAR